LVAALISKPLTRYNVLKGSKYLAKA